MVIATCFVLVLQPFWFSPGCLAINQNLRRRKTREAMRPVKHVEKGLTLVAGALHDAIQSVNKYKPNPSFTPKWSDKPLLKSWQKSKPTLGWPRTTDSLCPNCVIEARESILSGKQDVSVLIMRRSARLKHRSLNVTARFGWLRIARFMVTSKT